MVLGGVASLAWGQPTLVWKTPEASVTFQQQETEPLRVALRRFLNQYAAHPTHLVLHPNLPRHSALTDVHGTPSAIFRLLLARNDLVQLHQNDLEHVLPRRQAWKVVPVRQVLEQPTPLREVLSRLAQQGWVPLTLKGLPEKTMVSENLVFPSVANAFQVLAERYDAHVIYHAQTHHLTWVTQSAWQTAVVPLTAPEAEVQALLNAPGLQPSLEALQVSFLRPELLLLEGPAPELETVQAVIAAEESVSKSNDFPAETGIAPPQAQTLVLQTLPEATFRQHLDDWTRQPDSALQWTPQSLGDGLGWSVTLTGPPDEVEAAAASLMRLENQLQLEVPPETGLVVRRFELKFLQVQDAQVQSSGESLQVPGAQSLLKQFLEHRFQQDPAIPDAEVLADPVGNALIVQAPAETLQAVEALLKAWDRPRPQIQIEAHIFETTEQDSQRLGVEFASRPSGSAAEPFTLGARLEGATTLVSPVEARLRMLEEAGRGRVLSRPVIVTTNNVEAEVNSGSRINVKLYENRSLQELQTGVTLRVTPRVVQASPDEAPLIALTIRAETSTPSNTQVIDGIPVINTQRAESMVTVPSGRPFLLSGLIKSRSEGSTAGVPMLSDLPLLGVLFQSQGQEQRFDHVVVIVTPRVLSRPEPVAIPEFPGAQQAIQQP